MSLPFKHISETVEDLTQIIDDRRQGKISSLKTGKKKLDDATFQGLLWNRIITIAGMSGSGKSLTLEELKYNLITLNPEEKIEVLSFELEMLGTDQVARRISAQVGKSQKYLYSCDHNTVSDEEWEIIGNIHENPEI